MLGPTVFTVLKSMFPHSHKLVNLNKIEKCEKEKFVISCRIADILTSYFGSIFSDLFFFPPAADQLGWIPSFPPWRLSSSHWGKLSFVDTATVGGETRGIRLKISRMQFWPRGVLATCAATKLTMSGIGQLGRPRITQFSPQQVSVSASCVGGGKSVHEEAS